MTHKIARNILIGLGLVVCGLSAQVVLAIEALAPIELEERIAGSKGTLVVNITSTDPGCGYCIQANAKFAQLARSPDMVGVRFAQVSWEPWARFPEELSAFLQHNQITGIPARMVYKDGQLVNKVVGVPQDDVPAAPPKTPTSPLKVTGTIPVIDSHQADEKIRHSKGVLVVQLTSFETSCSFCIRSNPIFEALADAPENIKVKFVRITYRPWEQMVNDPFAQTFGYTGLPVFATYKDGKFLRKQGGMLDQAELQKVLLSGLE